MMCPVCGWNFLADDALNHDICPSCGTEFGYDDAARTYEELRTEWLLGGGEWFDKMMGPPAGWDPLGQVVSAFHSPRLVASKPISTEFELDIPISGTEEPLPIAG